MTAGPVLILFCHPALQKSRAGVHLLAALQGLHDVTVHDLYEEYPTFHVDVPREQAMLLRHRTVIAQHPIYWYSVPPLLKQWQDLVLEYDWAYGPDGHALRDKVMLHAVTTGGRRAAYAHDGHNRYTIAEFMRPLEQTARLCGMRWLPPFAVHAAGGIPPETLRDRYGAAYRRLVLGLRDGTLDLTALARHDYCNDALDVDTGR